MRPSILLPRLRRRLGEATIRAVQSLGSERGDVPGWVLVTLMTAGLVIAIWALAGDALAEVFQTAIDRVMGV